MDGLHTCMYMLSLGDTRRANHESIQTSGVQVATLLRKLQFGARLVFSSASRANSINHGYDFWEI